MHGLGMIRRMNDEQVRRERNLAKLRKAGRISPVNRYVPHCCGSEPGNRKTVLAAWQGLFR